MLSMVWKVERGEKKSIMMDFLIMSLACKYEYELNNGEPITLSGGGEPLPTHASSDVIGRVKIARMTSINICRPNFGTNSPVKRVFTRDWAEPQDGELVAEVTSNAVITFRFNDEILFEHDDVPLRAGALRRNEDAFGGSTKRGAPN